MLSLVMEPFIEHGAVVVPMLRTSLVSLIIRSFASKWMHVFKEDMWAILEQLKMRRKDMQHIIDEGMPQPKKGPEANGTKQVSSDAWICSKFAMLNTIVGEGKIPGASLNFESLVPSGGV